MPPTNAGGQSDEEQGGYNWRVRSKNATTGRVRSDDATTGVAGCEWPLRLRAGGMCNGCQEICTAGNDQEVVFPWDICFSREGGANHPIAVCASYGKRVWQLVTKNLGVGTN